MYKQMVILNFFHEVFFLQKNKLQWRCRISKLDIANSDDHVSPGNMLVDIVFEAVCSYENVYDFQFENMILNETFISFLNVHKSW